MCHFFVFPYVLIHFLIPRRFHLTVYRVFHQESESELKNYQILQPYAAFFLGKTDLIKIMSPDAFFNFGLWDKTGVG